MSGPPTFPAFGAGYVDNSNSQYGLLGVWSGAEVGVEVPGAYWQDVERHWTRLQADDGRWGYMALRKPNPASKSLSMTVAGIASLFITHDYLDGPHFGAAVGREPFSPALARALAWLEEGDHCVTFDERSPWGYTLYGIERVGLASGFKYFGSHDWYRELAADALGRQLDDGSWDGVYGKLIETSFALLFLARGRHPILMNKLRFDRGGGVSDDGYWANRPRDVANLARFATRHLERPLNWQVVPLRRPWTDWLDSPILYLASHQPPKLGGEDYAKLKSFVEAGGLLFTQADGDSPAFNAFAHQLAERLFPQYPLKALPPDHGVYSLLFQINPPPPMKAVSNGSRLLMVHAPKDISKAWQVRDEKVSKHLFQFGVNLFAYAAGKRELRNRLDLPYIPEPDGAADGDGGGEAVKVARLRYDGNWDPEPAAWPRFARWLAWRTGVRAELVRTSLADLRPDTAPVAHLTGTASYELTDAEAEAVARYVRAGGVLLVDTCGGQGGFEEGVRVSLMTKAFPGGKLKTVAKDHPLLGKGPNGMEDLSTPRLRRYVLEKLGRDAAGAFTVLADGEGHVVFTPMDVVSGLLGTRTWGIVGYDADYAQAFVKNLVFWAVDGQARP